MKHILGELLELACFYVILTVLFYWLFSVSKAMPADAHLQIRTTLSRQH